FVADSRFIIRFQYAVELKYRFEMEVAAGIARLYRICLADKKEFIFQPGLAEILFCFFQQHLVIVPKTWIDRNISIESFRNRVKRINGGNTPERMTHQYAVGSGMIN